MTRGIVGDSHLFAFHGQINQQTIMILKYCLTGITVQWFEFIVIAEHLSANLVVMNFLCAITWCNNMLQGMEPYTVIKYNSNAAIPHNSNAFSHNIV